MTLVLAVDDSGGPEIFASLQGEGASAGEPCAFVRLSRCNLACAWCDTAYTWRFAGPGAYDRKAEQIVLAEAEVAERIRALGRDRLVITGGEPLLQGAALARLATLLGVRPRGSEADPKDQRGGLSEWQDDGRGGPRRRGDSPVIEIETNGTLAPHPALDPLVAQYNVSPKLAHSGNPAARALIPERLAAFAADPRAFFKFVVAEPSDLAEVLALAARYAIAAERLFVMPEGTDSATLRERAAWLADWAATHGVRVSDRLHIHLYGDTRGT